jgi:hypothetical protein
MAVARLKTDRDEFIAEVWPNRFPPKNVAVPQTEASRSSPSREQFVRLKVNAVLPMEVVTGDAGDPNDSQHKHAGP